jgi:hypothetical protein
VREVDISYYNPRLGGDPHFCSVCKLRNDQDRSLLNYVNYRAWTNYGMC